MRKRSIFCKRKAESIFCKRNGQPAFSSSGRGHGAMASMWEHTHSSQMMPPIQSYFGHNGPSPFNRLFLKTSALRAEDTKMEKAEAGPCF